VVLVQALVVPKSPHALGYFIIIERSDDIGKQAGDLRIAKLSCRLFHIAAKAVSQELFEGVRFGVLVNQFSKTQELDMEPQFRDQPGRGKVF
jgi:hypothetical protein